MSSFTTPPVVSMVGLYEWKLHVPYTYYRPDILKEDGTVKPVEEYTEEDRHLRSWDKIVIPAGFVTDLATIPRWLWSIFPPHDYYAKAAILHDYLYETATGTKEEADYVFYEALGVLGMPKWQRKLFYWGVRLIGRGNY